jgi:hypothetical protein
MKKGLAAVLFVITVLLCSCSGQLTPSPYAEFELDSDGAVSLYTQDNVYVPDAKSMRL